MSSIEFNHYLNLFIKLSKLNFRKVYYEVMCVLYNNFMAIYFYNDFHFEDLNDFPKINGYFHEK